MQPSYRYGLILFSGVIIALNVVAFCGFYVAKADAKLFNKSSQVILTRDGETTTVTMSSDFEGDAQEFAMVIPVPTVLKKDDIQVVDRKIFDFLDAYSAPRLAEYHDPNPCYRYDRYYEVAKSTFSSVRKLESLDEFREADLKVKIEAKYTVGEYDVLILSSTESKALKTWLIGNGYKIPKNAEEVLEPYIKSNLKFFVVKVNISEKEKLGISELRPIQMRFQSSKFMLPIRLGMANAMGHQDMMIYAFSKKGRVETTNYRTMKVPTDRNIPEFVRDTFGAFYKSVFDRVWKNNQNAVFLEYAWNLSGDNFVKCDPCSTTPPSYTDLADAGVHWLKRGRQNRGFGGADYSGDVYFTRLHVRYNRTNFPQDLDFQETPNHENFQGRYVMHIAVKEKLNCEASKDYYLSVASRRREEVVELEKLTGWPSTRFASYTYQFSPKTMQIESDDIYDPK